MDEPEQSQLDFGPKPYLSRPKDSSYDVNPDDIDIEVPEEQLATELQPIVDVVSTDMASSKKAPEPVEVSTIF